MVSIVEVSMAWTVETSACEQLQKPVHKPFKSLHAASGCAQFEKAVPKIVCEICEYLSLESWSHAMFNMLPRSPERLIK